MIKIKFAGDYVPMLRMLLDESPEIAEIVNEKIKLFRKNPNDRRLSNHPLKKALIGKWAFSITGDIRVIYKITGKNNVSFLAIGGHHKVYGVLR